MDRPAVTSPQYGKSADAATITRLLERLERGERAALDELFPLIHEELRALAHRHRQRWFGDDTLGTTALVNEAYLKLVGQQRLGATSRAHFLAVAAKAMRHILGNYAEARRRLKRGGDSQRISLDDAESLEAPAPLSADQADTIAALDDALRKLAATNERLSRVVECRFFADLSIADTAEVLGTSAATVKRDWLVARAWLHRELAGQTAGQLFR